MKHFKTKASLIALGVFALFALLQQLNLNPLYPDGAFFWCAFVSVFVLILASDRIGRVVMVRAHNAQPSVQFLRSTRPARWPLYIVAGVWALFFLTEFGSSVLFHVNAYRDQMPELTEMSFTDDFKTADLSQLPIVDEAMAKKLADKKLGERPSLGSQVVLGEPTLQQVDGKLVWAVPTYHSGFFKWITNLSGTPGYVCVSATNPQDVEYVDGYSIKYQPGAYFLQNLAFHTRYSAALFTGVTDYSFELDDTGRPFWVITTYRYLRGFALPEATGAIVMDCATGKSARYAIGALPAWVDRVQPENFIMQQLNNKGAYVHGYLNFSDKDKFETSEGDAIIYNDGRCYLFTGLTSVGSDESTIGLVMVDMVTKQPRLYRISGATEYAAQLSAQGKVQQYGYRAAFPLIINLNGAPTYFMTLQDTEGLIKQYAYVSVEDYQTVGVGETIPEARLNFEKALRASGAASVGNTADKATTLTGTVQRIGSEYTGSTTAYYIVLEGHDDVLFSVQGSLSDELAVTREGDRVSVTYYEKDGGTQDVSVFDNLEFTQ